MVIKLCNYISFRIFHFHLFISGIILCVGPIFFIMEKEIFFLVQFRMKNFLLFSFFFPLALYFPIQIILDHQARNFCLRNIVSKWQLVKFSEKGQTIELLTKLMKMYHQNRFSRTFLLLMVSNLTASGEHLQNVLNSMLMPLRHCLFTAFIVLQGNSSIVWKEAIAFCRCELYAAIIIKE